MSTNDVPGYKAHNNDELAMGCWAEHEDGSLILVEGTEGGNVVYSIFDMDKKPIPSSTPRISWRNSLAMSARLPAWISRIY